MDDEVMIYLVVVYLQIEKLNVLKRRKKKTNKLIEDENESMFVKQMNNAGRNEY